MGVFFGGSRCGGILAGVFLAFWQLAALGIALAQTDDQPNPAAPGTSFLIEPGTLPDYELLRYTEGEEQDFTAKYLRSLPTFSDDVVTSSIVFPEVPESADLHAMTLPQLIEVARENNFQLQNSRRSVLIARSQTRSAEADFIPFVDIVADSRYEHGINRNATRFDPETGLQVDTVQRTDTYTNQGGIESGVDLPTGGQITLDSNLQRVDQKTDDGGGSEGTRNYSSNAEVRFLQPLLRGGGIDVGTADLRSARLSEIDQVLDDRLAQRDVAFDVIQSYFEILQAARSLEVSRDAITIRLQFLEETKIRFSEGRVDQSEILRAEINYLRELQTAIERRRNLDQQRENMLILLGLPLDTPISFVDITAELAERGRMEVPPETTAMSEALDQRMELMQSDIGVTQARLSKAVARNDVLPTLNFDAGYNRSDAATGAQESLGFVNEGWDAGLGLRIPLVNIQRREAYRRAILSLEQVETNRLSLERSISQEALSARRNVLATEVQLTILRKSVEQARKSLELINGRFEVGFATVTEVRLAQDDLFSVETNYNNTLLNYQTALARLYVALGRPLI